MPCTSFCAVRCARAAPSRRERSRRCCLQLRLRPRHARGALSRGIPSAGRTASCTPCTWAAPRRPPSASARGPRRPPQPPAPSSPRRARQPPPPWRPPQRRPTCPSCQPPTACRARPGSERARVNKLRAHALFAAARAPSFWLLPQPPWLLQPPWPAQRTPHAPCGHKRCDEGGSDELGRGRQESLLQTGGTPSSNGPGPSLTRGRARGTLRAPGGASKRVWLQLARLRRAQRCRSAVISPHLLSCSRHAHRALAGARDETVRCVRRMTAASGQGARCSSSSAHADACSALREGVSSRSFCAVGAPPPAPLYACYCDGKIATYAYAYFANAKAKCAVGAKFFWPFCGRRLQNEREPQAKHARGWRALSHFVDPGRRRTRN